MEIKKGYHIDHYSKGGLWAVFPLLPIIFQFLGQEFEDDFFDDYIEPKDYLPKSFKASSYAVETPKTEKVDVEEASITNSTDIHQSGPFLAKMEEVAESPGIQEENKPASAGNLLLQNDCETFTNDTAAKTTQDMEPTNQLICNRLEIKSHASLLNLKKVNYTNHS